MGEHTPGPWFVERGTIVRYDREANPSHWRSPAVCHTGMTHGMGVAGLEDEANARLIAAAPDLLAALREVGRLRLATSEGSLRVRADRMWEIARQAIAKAEGR